MQLQQKLLMVLQQKLLMMLNSMRVNLLMVVTSPALKSHDFAIDHEAFFPHSEYFCCKSC